MKTSDSYPNWSILRLLLALLIISILVGLCSCNTDEKGKKISSTIGRTNVETMATIEVGTTETLQYKDGSDQYFLNVRYCGLEENDKFRLSSCYTQYTYSANTIILESAAISYPYNGTNGRKESLFIKLDSPLTRFTLEVLEIEPDRITLRITGVED